MIMERPPLNQHFESLTTQDYRCTEGRFSLSARGVTILNSPSLSSSKTEVRDGIKSWKARLLLSAE